MIMNISSDMEYICINVMMKFAALLGGGGATTLEMFPSWPIRTHQTLPTVRFLLL